MSKSNTPLTDPTVHQILFGDPIEEFIDSIDLKGNRTSKTKTKPKGKGNGPMIPPEHRDLVKRRMNTIDKIATEGPLLSEDDLNRYHRLKEKKRQANRPVKSSSVGSAKTGLFDLDTGGASKAVSEFASKKRRADNEKYNMTIAASLGELEEKKKESDRNTELREDLIKDIPESIEEETEREDDEKQRYYNAGLRYISQGKFDKAVYMLRQSGLSTSEINHEMSLEQEEPKTQESGSSKQGEDLNGGDEGSIKPNLETDSVPSDASVEKIEESNKKEKPTGFMKFLKDGKEFMNYWLKMWQHPIEGEKNLQLLDDMKDKEPGQEPSWKELNDQWEENIQGFIENQKGTEPSIKAKDDNKDRSSADSSGNTSKLNTLEKAVDELEKDADSDHQKILENIRMELQDMRSSGKI